MLKPEWIASVVHFRKSASDIGLGPYLILPAYCDPVESEEDPAGFYTPEMVPPSHPPVIARESRLESGFEPELTTGGEEEEVVTEESGDLEDIGGEVAILDTTREDSVMFDHDCPSGKCSDSESQ